MQRYSGGLLHKELKQEKVSKMLTQIKLGVVVVPENRATFQKNTVIKRFKLKIRWFTTLPLGGGGYKPRKFTIFRTKNDMILLPFIPVKKCDTRGVSWGKPEAGGCTQLNWLSWIRT